VKEAVGSSLGVTWILSLRILRCGIKITKYLSSGSLCWRCRHLNQAPRKRELNTTFWFEDFWDMARGRLADNVKIIFKVLLGASGSGWYLRVGCSKHNSVAVSYAFHPISTRVLSKHERVVT